MSYDRLNKILLTCSADGRIGVWSMNAKRDETPKWLESDQCQICYSPFFWNINAMWKQKCKIVRQHPEHQKSQHQVRLRVSEFGY